MTSKAPLALVGPGSAGSTLVTALSQSGWPILGVLARDSEGAEAAAARLGVPSLGSTKKPAAALAKAGILILAVRDDEISELAEHLAQHGDWNSRCVLHLSGSLGSDALEAFARRGASVGSFHPLMTFVQPAGRPAASLPADTPFFIEGGEAALAQCRELARALGVETHELTAEAKVLYHCAATMAGNFVTSLLASAAELLEAAGVEGGARVLAPLARESAAAAGTQKPEIALTGPIARGDVSTLRAHVTAMEQAGVTASVRELHLVLSEATAGLARLGGRGTVAQQEEIRRLLQATRESLASPDRPSPPPEEPGELH